MERHQRIQLKTTSRSTNQPVSVSSFQTRGFGVQQKAASTPASKAELWENYQRSSQMTQQGAGGTRSAIQTKLSIGQPGDKYEQEADSVADRVMAMSEPAQVQREELGEEEEELQMKPLAGMISPLVQREELPEEEEELQMKPEDYLVQREELPEEEEELQMKSLDNSIQREELPEEEEELQMKPEDNAIQREALPEEEEELQAKSLDNSIQREALPEEEEEIQTKQSPSSNVPVSTPSLEHRLSSSKGGGNPLSDDVRSFMEPRFGADFSSVRVHTGSDAVQMNQDVNAQAFAHGSDVYFGAGKAPGKDALTAHELTHVVQQNGSPQLNLSVNKKVQAKLSNELLQRDLMPPMKIPGGMPGNLDRLKGDLSSSIKIERDPSDVEKNSVATETPLPFEDKGWNGDQIAQHLGQHDRIAGTDSDNNRCVQAVALINHVLMGPQAVDSYLSSIILQGILSRKISDRRRTAIEVINYIRAKIASRRATYGDLYWAIEAVHDIFYQDDQGTPDNELSDQLNPIGDISQTVQQMNYWCDTPAELFAQAQGLKKGEKLMIESERVMFNGMFERLPQGDQDKQRATYIPIDKQNKVKPAVTINRLKIKDGEKPSHLKIDHNRDTMSGHQLLIHKDVKSGLIKLYDPEITESGQHLSIISQSSDLKNTFTDDPKFEMFGYVRIRMKTIPFLTDL